MAHVIGQISLSSFRDGQLSIQTYQGEAPFEEALLREPYYDLGN